MGYHHLQNKKKRIKNKMVVYNINSGIFVGTGIYAAIGIVVQIILAIFPPSKDKSLTSLVLWTTVICCWLMWFVAYFMQMNVFLFPSPSVPSCIGATES